MEPILFYEGRGWQFSNFSAFEVFWNGWVCKTVEHGYQAAKFIGNHLDGMSEEAVAQIDKIRLKILAAGSPYEAKKIAQQHRDLWRPDWDAVKLSVMEELLRAKRDQHAYVRRKLRESGDAMLSENSPTDYFWGRGKDGTGLDNLGKLWMKIRSEPETNIV